jgi:hypothetical protein
VMALPLLILPCSEIPGAHPPSTRTGASFTEVLAQRVERSGKLSNLNSEIG